MRTSEGSTAINRIVPPAGFFLKGPVAVPIMLASSFDLLFLGFASLGFTWAGYIIDDTNSSVYYSPSVASSEQESWWPMSPNDGNYLISGNGSIFVPDYSRLYDQTM